jgi:hypothetical protein
MNTLTDIVKRQYEFQATMKSNKAEMYLALVAELGEMIDSMGAFTWKPSERDPKNLDIELIDVAVFAINLAYYEEQFKPTRVVDIAPGDFYLVETIINLLAARKYIDIAFSILHNRQDLLDVITAKQALNQLRQDYGYREGEYHKVWNGKEDNTYLERFYGKEYTEVYEAMEKIYTEEFIGGSLVNVYD